MILQPQPGFAPDSMMSVMSMYRYMLQGPNSTPDAPMDININPGRPPIAHSNLPLSNLGGMQSNFPSSHSAHSLFNPSPSPHSPVTRTQQGGPNDPSQQPEMPPYSHHGPPPPTSLTPVTSTNGNTSGGLVVPTPTRQRTIKSYHCRMCDQIFDNKSDLLVHSQTVHKADPKPYRCPTCQKCFANSSYLSQHARIHAGIKPYKCQICERRFTQLCHLQQHIRTHTGEKPYKCQHPSCGKAFSQLSNLQSHSRSHMTDKPYRCNSCYKCFTDEQGLRDHIPKHSETKHLKTFICRICGKSYTQETYLARHMTKHQGVDPAANMLNLTSLRHQQAQQAQAQQQQNQGSSQIQTSNSGMSPHPSPNSIGMGGPPQQQSHHHQGTSPHQHHRAMPSPHQDLPDIKPFLENNGSDFISDPNKPSAFMPLPHQFSSPNMMNSSVPSNFPFPSTRLPSTTLNSGLSRLSPPSNSPYFPLSDLNPFPKRDSDRVGVGMPNLSPESMIANSLLRLQQIRDFSTHASHPVFPKSEPGSPAHKEFPHKEYSHKDYT